MPFNIPSAMRMMSYGAVRAIDLDCQLGTLITPKVIHSFGLTSVIGLGFRFAKA